METLLTWYLLIGLFNSLCNMEYHMHFGNFLEGAISALLFFFLWPIQLLFLIGRMMGAFLGFLGDKELLP